MEGDEILPEVKEILKLIAEANVILDTCHLGPREAIALVKEAKEIGVKKIIICHPNCSVNFMPIDVQKELAGLGALLSYAFLPCMPLFDVQDFRDVAGMMRAVGPENAIFFTDFGQFPNPTVVEGVRMFISSLLAVGFSDDEVKTIASGNYSRILD
jgi:predicted metal-dependent phosphotriesterase family hydrolase